MAEEYGRNGQRNTYSPIERGMASVVWRPQRWGQNFPDYTDGRRYSGRTIQADSAERPAVLRSQAYGHQFSDREFVYHQDPGDAPEHGGTACGGVLVCLPGMSMVRRSRPPTIKDRVDLNANVVFGPKVWRAFGWPNVDTCLGLLDGSWREGRDPDSGDHVLQWIDGDQPIDAKRVVPPQGVGGNPPEGLGTGYAELWGNPVMRWGGDWAGPGSEYGPGSVVKDNEWLMVATAPTFDRPGPQPSGDPYWRSGLGDTPAWSTVNVSETQILSGARYTPQTSGFYTAVRAWIPGIGGDLHYEIVVVRDPLGVPIVNVIPINPTSTGWFEFPAPGILLAGDTYDILLATTNQASSSSFGGPWDYETPNNPSIPDPGVIVHANRQIDELWVSDLDNTLADRSADLATVKAGDEIAAGGVTWVVQSASDAGTHFVFGVVPMVQIVDGSYTFSFKIYAPQPTDYVRIVDHYLGDAEVSGLFSTGEYKDAVVDDNAYGIDIRLQEAAVSNDWELVSLNRP